MRAHHECHGRKACLTWCFAAFAREPHGRGEGLTDRSEVRRKRRLRGTAVPDGPSLADMNLRTPPGFLVNIVTLGIARASWVAETNRVLGQGGAGFWFAWLLAPFAYFGLAGRLNSALGTAGSSHRESPFLCFLFAGWPFFGSKKRLKRGTERLMDAGRVGQHAGTTATAAVA